MSQAEALLALLKAGREVDPETARRELGTMRLAARVYDLRRAGYAIDERTERRGRKAWAVYFLKQPELFA